jgi:Fic family protein
MYNWQLKDWPNFQFDESLFNDFEKEFLISAGRVEGRFSHISKETSQQSLVDLLVNEAIKSSAIEGEMISRVDLISSIKRNLGYDTPSFHIKDKRSAGFAKLLVSSREGFNQPLTKEVLFAWHELLMQGAYINNVGKWRGHSEPMQIVSGSVGREKIHFEAPPSAAVPNEMSRFVEWFNSKNISNILIKAATAHLYFESIHPFEDGNGRIGRVVAEKSLSIGVGSPVLFSISTTTEQQRNLYYSKLNETSKTLQIDEWITWFCKMVLDSQNEFESLISFSIKKAAFFDTFRKYMNERQQKIVSRMLEEGQHFEGGMSTKKYVSITRTSKATATRDLQDLVEKGILKPTGEGRGRNYQVVI